MTTDTKIIERIQKLLRLARDKGATEAEAQTAMDAVNKLLIEHNLDLARVEGHKVQDIGEDNSNRSGKNNKHECYVWKGAAELNLCKYVVDSRQGDFIHIVIGTKVNVLAATLLAEYLVETVNRQAKEWGKTTECIAIATLDNVSEAMAKHKYKQGMASRLHERCLDLRDSRLQGKGNALVLYGDHAKALTQYIQQNHDTTDKATRVKGSIAMNLGKQAGDEVNLSQQVKSGQKSHKQIGAS